MKACAQTEAAIVKEQDIEVSGAEVCGLGEGIRHGAIAGVQEEDGGGGGRRGIGGSRKRFGGYPPAIDPRLTCGVDTKVHRREAEVEGGGCRRCVANGMQDKLPLASREENADGEIGAQNRESEDAAEGLEDPDRVDEVNHLRRGGAALRIVTGLLANRRFSARLFRCGRHDSMTASKASHGQQSEESDVAQWVRLCGTQEVPAPGALMEAEAKGMMVCLANVDGKLSALDNVCPHRGGPLGGGWLEGNSVVCPWHAWAFNTDTGIAEAPEKGRVNVFPVKIEGEDVMVDLG
jgi:nitrite reductase (NADH) small subunit